MIEKTIRDYLIDVLDVPVEMELPEVPSSDYPSFPASLVIIEKVGGTKTNHVSNASIAFQSYGRSLEAAAALDEVVREAVEDIVNHTDISGVRLASNYNFTDVTTKRYRYQCVYEVYYV